MGRLVRQVVLGASLAAAIVTWNAVFDAHVRAGARDYVDRQAAFVQGRGPRADMDAVMQAAVAGGLRSATLWALVVLVPGVVVVGRRWSRPSGVPDKQG
jgi:3-keto-L-gulonate-6-phosphate decarboxylase